MKLSQIAQIDCEEELKEQIKEKRLFIQEAQNKLITEIQEKISSINLIKKRKLDSENYSEVAIKLKRYICAAKNVCTVYFSLLLDENKVIIFTIQQFEQLVQGIRFSILRSVHNMNRILIKSTEKNQSPEKRRIKRRRKGKNSKMELQQTGSMYEWILMNFQNPYPTQQEKQKMGHQSNISIAKVNYWFINARERTLKKLMSFDKQKIEEQRQINQDSQPSSSDFH